MRRENTFSPASSIRTSTSTCRSWARWRRTPTRTGSQAALVGGTTTLIEMCCPARKDDALQSFELWMSQAVGKSACDFSFHMGVTKFDEKSADQLREIVKRGISSFKIFLAYKGALESTTRSSITRSNSRRNSAWFYPRTAKTRRSSPSAARNSSPPAKSNPGQHHESRPPTVEAEGVHHLMTFAELTGAATYIVHLSCKEALDQAIAARQRGVRVGVETLIQYLTLDKNLRRKTEVRGREIRHVAAAPRRAQPIRPLERLARWPRQHGRHRPRALRLQKPKNPWQGGLHEDPNGIPSLEERVNLLYNLRVKRGKIDLHTFVNVASTAVAKQFESLPEEGRDSARRRRRPRRFRSEVSREDFGEDATHGGRLQRVRRLAARGPRECRHRPRPSGRTRRQIHRQAGPRKIPAAQAESFLTNSARESREGTRIDSFSALRANSHDSRAIIHGDFNLPRRRDRRLHRRARGRAWFVTLQR